MELLQLTYRTYTYDVEIKKKRRKKKQIPYLTEKYLKI